jgi:gliding motility-associated-like protein
MKRMMITAPKNFKALFVFMLILVFFSSMVNAQLVAKFTTSVSQGCTPLPVNFTNQSTVGDSIQYFWSFGDGGTSTLKNPSYTYPLTHSGLYTVMLTVTDTKHSTQATITHDINVMFTPPANFTLSRTSSCANEKIVFKRPVYNENQKPDSILWSFGDGKTSKVYDPDSVVHLYTSNGTFNASYTTYNEICSATDQKTITVSGPVTGFTMSSDVACTGDPITFTIKSTSGVVDYQWLFDDGTSEENIVSVNHTYTNYGIKFPKLIATGVARSCTIVDTLQVYHVEAGIGYSDTLFCDSRKIYFQNLSAGNESNLWKFGDGADSISNDVNPRHIYKTGDYVVQLIVSNNYGCADTISDSITIHDNPEIQLGAGWFVCEGGSNTLQASGGDSISWNNASTLSDPHSYTPIATPTTTTNYQATVFYKATLCSSTGFIRVLVQEVPNWNITAKATRESVVIGDVDTITFNLNGNYLYEWSSEDSIVSADNDKIIILPNKARNDYAVYSLLVKDTNECFNYQQDVEIYVKEGYTMGLPAAFTPNDDNVNDIIKVDGWGIKALLEFKIYNRWGTEVYSGNDINTGWDGTFNDKPQPIDSYSYYIKAQMWDDKITEKKGTFTLIR